MSNKITPNRRVLAVCIGVVLMATVLLTGCPAPTAGVPPAYLLQWGSQGTGNGLFNRAWGIAVDTSGNVYVVDSNNSRIQKFTGNGAYLTQWGSGGTGNGQFYSPTGIAIDTTGNVYVADSGNSRIQKFTGTGAYINQWGSGGTGNGQFNAPTGVAVDTSGNVYVADSGNSRIQKFTGAGFFYLTKWGSQGNGNGQFNTARDIAVDAAGNVYVADSGNHRIQKFSNTGAFLLKWGSQGTGNGQFNTPTGVAVDTSGNVYVADSGNGRIQKFSNTGAFLLKWGYQGAGNGQFNTPTGVTIDTTGNVYVADSGNHRIQKFGKAPGPVTVPTGVGEAMPAPPLLLGTVVVNATLDGSPNILNTGTVTFTLTGPQQTYTGHATQTYPNMPVGNYTVGGIIGGPSGTLINITPSPAQTLAAGDTIIFTLNFRSNPVAAGTLIVNATLDGVTWTGTVSYDRTGPQAITGSSVPQTYASVPVGSYTLTNVWGGPPGKTLFNITPSDTQILTAGGTITFTLNFRTNKVDTGIVNVNAMLDGVAWTGALNFNVAGPSPISGTSVPLPYPNMPIGNYTLAYSSGGPSNAIFASVTPSATQALTAGGSVTFTLNFRTKPVETGTIIVNATLRQAAGIAPWMGTVSFTLTGTGLPTISGNSVNQTYTSVPVGNYTLTYVSGGPSGTTLFNTTPSSTQVLIAGGIITFTMEFR